MTRRLALLVNPTSGRGRHAGRVDEVAAGLASAGYAVTPMVGGDAPESAALARTAVADEYDALVVMGGDGMVHLALQAVVSTPTVLGVVATGTGNDVARSLGVPRRRPVDGAAVVAAGHTRQVDVAEADGVYYATVLAAGFDSLVNERANAMSWPRGQMRYNLATLAELRVFRPLSYSLDLDGQTVSLEAMLVAVGNCPSYGGGLRICEGASLDDGMLDVVIIKPVSRRELIKVYPRLFRGTHVTHPAYEHHQVRSVTVAADGIIGYADGERLGPLPMTVRVVPKGLTVFTPAP